MTQEYLQSLTQHLTKRYGDDISQRIIVELLEGSLPAHLIERRAQRLRGDEKRLNKRLVPSSHPQVHRAFYGEVD
jgi:hypothetical protein